MNAAECFDDQKTRQLAEAAESGDLGAISALIAGGADPNGKGRGGITPLAYALIKQNAAGFEALLKAGGDPNTTFPDGTALAGLGAMAADAVFLHALLEHGARVPQKLAGSEGPLHVAARHGRHPHLEMLIQADAPVDLRDKRGNTALYLSASVGDSKGVKTLLAVHADPMLANQYGVTPEEIARLNNHDGLLPLF